MEYNGDVSANPGYAAMDFYGDLPSGVIKRGWPEDFPHNESN
jgi:hypothetical protein